MRTIRQRFIGFIAARRRVLRIASYDAAILLVLLVGLELIVRTVDPRYTRHLFDREFTGSAPVAMNADGYRGRLVPLTKEKDEIRVLALGDSVTFGTGIEWQDAWPQRLADRLEKETGRPVSVINAALPATDIDQMRVGFQSLSHAYQPDVVVLLLTGNTVSLGWIRRDDPDGPPQNEFLAKESPSGSLGRLRTEIRRSIKLFALPGFGSLNVQRAMFWIGLLRHDVDPDDPAGVMLAQGWIQGGLHPGDTDGAWEEFAHDVEHLRSTIEDTGVPLIASYAPPRFTLTDRLIDNEKAVRPARVSVDATARALALLERLAIPSADCRTHLLEARRQSEGFAPLYRQFDYSHFDAAGHDAIASAFMAPVLDALGPLDR